MEIDGETYLTLKNYHFDSIGEIRQEDFYFIAVRKERQTLRLTLNRPNKKNALHPQMLNEIAFAMHYAYYSKAIWSLIIEARGDVFCAGADLSALSGEVESHHSKIPLPENEVVIVSLFSEFSKPIIALVTRNVYAGGMLIIGGSTYVLADPNVSFSLPETKRGLWPFQVMQSLSSLIPQRKLLDWCIRGHAISANEAMEWGLISHVINEDDQESILKELLNEIHENSPTAIKKGLKAWSQLSIKEDTQINLAKLHEELSTSPDAQEGIKAFKERRTPKWEGS